MIERSTRPAPRPATGPGDKQRAVLAGALTVFARDGYARASIDAIAEQAQVSSRTIYNHFTDKAGLFHALLVDSAGRVAEAQIALIDRYLHKVTDLEADLIEFGRVWATPVAEHADHFALVRHINADAQHIPQRTIDAWQQAGPLRVRHELARRMQQLSDQGMLVVADAERAANHFVLLTTVPNPSLTSRPPSDQQRAETVTAGVRAFLHGYLAR